MNDTIVILRAQGWDEELLKAIETSVDLPVINSAITSDNKINLTEFSEASTQGAQFYLSNNLVAV